MNYGNGDIGIIGRCVILEVTNRPELKIDTGCITRGLAIVCIVIGFVFLPQLLLLYYAMQGDQRLAQVMACVTCPSSVFGLGCFVYVLIDTLETYTPTPRFILPPVNETQ